MKDRGMGILPMTDEIMAEVRRIRDRYAAKHGHNLDAIYADIKQREAVSKRPLVDLASRRKAQRR